MATLPSLISILTTPSPLMHPLTTAIATIDATLEVDAKVVISPWRR